MYNSIMYFIHQTKHSIKEFSKYAKHEIVPLIALTISWIVMFLSFYYMFMHSVIDASKIDASSIMLKVSFIFVYILIVFYVVLNSKYDQQPALPNIKNDISVEHEIIKFSIKWNNMLRKDWQTLIILLILTTFNVLILFFGGLEKYTLSTGYELYFEKLICLIIFIVLYSLYVIMMFLFASSDPTKEYVKENILKFIEFNGSVCEFNDQLDEIPNNQLNKIPDNENK